MQTIHRAAVNTQQPFRGQCRLHLHGRRKSSAGYLHHAAFLLGLFFNPQEEDSMFLRNPLFYNGLYGVISRKLDLFIITAVRTPNLTFVCQFVFQEIKVRGGGVPALVQRP
jgi:hypothetical protein